MVELTSPNCDPACCRQESKKVELTSPYFFVDISSLILFVLIHVASLPFYPSQIAWTLNWERQTCCQLDIAHIGIASINTMIRPGANVDLKSYWIIIVTCTAKLVSAFSYHLVKNVSAVSLSRVSTDLSYTTCLSYGLWIITYTTTSTEIIPELKCKPPV